MGSLAGNVEDIEIQISSLNIQDTKNKSPKSSEYQINETTSYTDEDIGSYVLQFRDELLRTKNMNFSKWANTKITLTEELIKRSHKIAEFSKKCREYEPIATDLDDSISSVIELSDKSDKESQFIENVDEITTRLSNYKSLLKDFLKSVRKEKKKTAENKKKKQQQKLKKAQKS